ncbi:sucrase ferredoxin [Agrobacterium rosae]|uniref:Sucrase ferredoxin n=1 Tax=Agrobacterium rosae TaxID=1972867 RepID=A0A1R3U663_9HYPH|nr:sucrase ferredoxin [Agrobacterium rosae]MCM2435586.1 hypothetical protein [Agrobacterium rosae]MDX8331652.1 sucrase ferredoxin [Agrobacterium rosae]SCX34276.1 Sucrase/ferredoxin-like protein [Agrobacterium rosae]
MGNAATRYALLPWPRGDWRSPRYDSAGMSSEISLAIQLANAAGIHVALVSGTLSGLFCDGIVAHITGPEDAARLLRKLAAGEALEGESDERKTILCCADSRHDACCARYGFATWKALVAEADPEKFHILQTTHLGGCRFAASIIVLPERARYGKLEPHQVAEFLKCLEDGIPFLPGYRGNPALAEIDQVLEHAASSWAAAHNMSAPTQFVPGELKHADERHFTAVISGKTLQITLNRIRFPLNGNCRSIGGTPPHGEVLRWVASSVELCA